MAPPKTLPANFSGWDAPKAPPATLPKDFNQWDAPANSSSQQPDIFDQAAAQPDIFDRAAAPQKDFSQRVGDRIGQNVNAPPHLLLSLADGMKEALTHPNAPTTEAGKKLLYPFGDSAAEKAAGVATVGPRAAYSAGSDLFQQYLSDPANLVGDIITAHVFHGIGDDGEGTNKTQPKGTTKPSTASSADSGVVLDRITHATGVISPRFANAIEDIRAGNYGKALAHALPVDIPARIGHLQQLVKSLAEGPEAPAPPTPELPNVYGTPREQWGKTIPEPQAAAKKPRASTPVWRDATRQNVPYAGEGDIFDRVAASSSAAQAPKVEPANAGSAPAPKTATPPIYPVKKVSEWGVADQNKQMIRALSPARQGLNADFSSLGNYQPGKSVVAHTFGDVTDDAAVEDALRNDLAKMAASGEFEEQRAMRAGSSADVPKAQHVEEASTERLRKLRDLQGQRKAMPPEFTAPWALSHLQ